MLHFTMGVNLWNKLPSGVVACNTFGNLRLSSSLSSGIEYMVIFEYDYS